MSKTTQANSAGKKFYYSKTFWVNIIGITAIVVQSQTGYVIPPETQAAALGLVNFVLRLVTKEPIEV